jgi:hypothetical protein
MCAVLLSLTLICLNVSYSEDNCTRRKICKGICVCYWTLLPHAYFSWHKVKIYSDPAVEKSRQALQMTTTRGVGKVPANPAVLGPHVSRRVPNIQYTEL